MGTRLVIATDKVNEDEPCTMLREEIANNHLGKRRRYQIIKVVRGDRIAEFRRDLGKAEAFKANPFQIPGCGGDGIPVHNVGELVEIANYLREEKPRHPEKPMQNLLADYYYRKELEEKEKVGWKQFGFKAVVP